MSDIEREPTVSTPVPLAGLRRRAQIRHALDEAHVERLAEVLDRCPPILLSADGTLIDGEHRVEAAKRLGHTTLPAVTVPGDTDAGGDDDLIRAIEANSSHGLPLSRVERRDAVATVVTARPATSDREIARICGVSRGVVARIRAGSTCSGGSKDHLNTRVGADGKRYGTLEDGWQAHLEALIRLDPATSVRTLAEHTGASVGTVQSLRSALLEQVGAELRLVRWWRRLCARWTLRQMRGGQASQP